MFKKFNILCFFLLSIIPFSWANEQLIQECGNVNPALDELFDHLEYEKDWQAEEINDIAQKKYARKGNIERSQMQEIHLDKKDFIYKALQKLRVIDAVFPKNQHYDVIVIHGAKISGMRMRVDFLDKLWAQGLRAKQIVFFVGQRTLDPNEETLDYLFKQQMTDFQFRKGWIPPINLEIKNEAEAAKIVWDQIVKNENLRNMPVTYVSVPSKTDPITGEEIRATTADTVVAWAKMNPKPVKILAISSNPHINYQHATMYGILNKKGYFAEKSASLETVGPAAGKNTLMSVHLDNIAGWLCAELKNRVQ